jgi:nicotinamidase/pyrazinamidase
MTSSEELTQFPPDTALLLVDIQNDFCPGGSLAVPEGDHVVTVANKLIPRFKFAVATQDWHPANHISFKARGGPWPPHCVQGTFGAEIHPGVDTKRVEAFVRKAFTPDQDAYSEFEGKTSDGLTLDEVLSRRGIRTIYLTGLATDYCVKATALDGLKKGYDVYIVTDGIRAVEVNPGDGAKAIAEMAAAGAHLITSEQILGKAQASP